MNSNPFNNIFALENNIKVYIASKDKNGDLIDNKVRATTINNTIKTFSTLFGGATSYNALGSWVNSDNKLMVEPVEIIESYFDSKDINAKLSTALKHIHEVKKELNQEAVSIEYNNKLYFI